jgi:glycine cleavage system transcriptional repressor
MRHFALSAIGRDRPGIVAAVAEKLLKHGINIEDSEMTILRGHFTMTLVLSAPDELDAGGLRADLEAVRERLTLDAFSLSELAEREPARRAVATHVVTVYGADHPGIVHAVTAALAQRGINITDLTTRLVDQGDGEPLYMLTMEIVLPDAVEPNDLDAMLAGRARAGGRGFGPSFRAGPAVGLDGRDGCSRRSAVPTRFPQARVSAAWTRRHR